MNRSTKLVLFGIVLPGMATSAVYGVIRHDADPAAEQIRLELREADVRQGIEVDVERIVREAVEHAERVGASAGACAVSRGETLRVSANGVERLRVAAGAGTVEVVGIEDADEVVVDFDACAATSELLAELDVSLEVSGAVAEVATRYPGSGGWSGGDDRYARIDLRVEVPAELAAHIQDGSGRLRVSGVRTVDLQDGSGPLLVRDVGGHVTVQDGSGSIDLIGIGGDVTLEDGSGSVEISDVTGSVRLTDGSGSLDLTAVGGDVEVRADGSGSIEVADVGGDFTVLSDGSGSIRMREVRGAVDVPEKGGR